MSALNPLFRLIGAAFFTILSSNLMWCQWSRLPGPYGGNVQQFARDGDVLYALTPGGIYKSDSGGDQWNLVENAESLGRQKNSENWYYQWLYADGGRLLLLSRDNRLLRSMDGGKSWKTIFDVSLDAGSPKEYLTGCFAAGDTIFAGSERALYRSADAGASWEKVPDPDFWGPLQVVAKIKDTFIGRRRYSIVKSTDGGQTWKNNFTIGPPFAAVNILDTTIFGMYSKYGRLIRSENQGLGWEKFDTDTIRFSKNFEGFPGWLAGAGADLYFGTDNGCFPRLFRSPDRGETWLSVSPEVLAEQQLRDLNYLDSGLLTGTNLGVYRSGKQGNSFSASHSGMNAAWVDDLFQMPDGRWWAVARQGIFRSADQGQTWEDVFPGEIPAFCFETRGLPRTAKRMFYPGEYNCQFVSSDDNGNTWTPLPTDWPPYLCPSIAVTRDAAWFRAYSGLLYRWRDQDLAPEPYEMPLLNEVGSLIAGNGMLLMAGEQEAYVSADQGENWQQLPPLQFWNGKPEHGHHFYMDHNALFHLGGMQHDSLFVFFYAENKWRPYFPVDAISGDTFTPNAIRILRFSGGLRWMRVNGQGLYYSGLQEPDRWYPYQPALPAVTPLSLYLNGDEIWIGTAEAGIFSAPLRLKTVDGPAPQFSLYPNPGRGEAARLDSDRFFSETLRLRMIDATGRLIHEQILPPGQSWTPDLPAGLPPGMYFFQLEAAQFRTALKWIRQR